MTESILSVSNILKSMKIENGDTKPISMSRISKEKIKYNISILIDACYIIDSCRTLEETNVKPLLKLFNRGITSGPTIRKRVVDLFMEEKNLLTWEYILSKVSGNHAKIWVALCLYVNNGFIMQIGKGRRGTPYKYYLSPGITRREIETIENKFEILDDKVKRAYRIMKQELNEI